MIATRSMTARSIVQRTRQVLGCIAALAAALLPAAAQAGTQYKLVELGSLGGNFSSAVAINDRGWVVGRSALADGSIHAFVYDGTARRDLGTLGAGYSSSSAAGINNSGQIVGSSGGSGVTRGFLYDANGMQALPTFGGANSSASGINDAGWIVGEATDAVGEPQAFILDASGMHALTFPEPNYITTAEINNSGQVVGGIYLYLGRDTSAFATSPGGMPSPLDVFGGPLSQAYAINDLGQFVGGATRRSFGDEHAFLYDGTGFLDLGTLGGEWSAAFGINNAGQVVGWSIDADNDRERAFLYSHGQMIDLNTQIDPALGWHLWQANDINESGWIVGTGTNASGRNGAFLLIPTVPEPSSLALASLGFAAAGAIATRGRAAVGR